MAENYRIVKITYEKSNTWIVQKRCRLLYFGPKIWQTYRRYPDHYCDGVGYGWNPLISYPETFESEELAKEFIEREHLINSRNRKLKSEITQNINYES